MKDFDWKFWIAQVLIPLAMLLVMVWGVRVEMQNQQPQQPPASQPQVEAPRLNVNPDGTLKTAESGWPDLSPYWPIGLMVLLIVINTSVASRHRRGLSVTARALALAVAKVKELNDAAAARKPYPKVEIWRHESASSDLAEKVRTLFEKAGWEVSHGHATDLPQHSKGVTLCGGTNVEKNAATWGLGTLNVKPKIEYRNEDPPNLQVIIGAVRPAELQTVGEWAIKQIASEHENAISALATCRKDFSIARLKWIGDRAKSNNAKIAVRIRFADYADYELVQKIEGVLKEHTDWEIEIDGTNKPVIKPVKEHENPLERFKVIFDTGHMLSLGEIGSAIKDGGFIKDVVFGFRTTDRFDGPLIIEVLPTIRRSDTNG